MHAVHKLRNGQRIGAQEIVEVVEVKAIVTLGEVSL